MTASVLQGSWKGKSAIIGFFWAKAADCDFVMVTRAGLELYTLAADRQAGTAHTSTSVTALIDIYIYIHLYMHLYIYTYICPSHQHVPLTLLLICLHET